MDDHQPHVEEQPVLAAWHRLLQIVFGVFLLVGTALMVHYYSPAPPPVAKVPPPPAAPKEDLQKEMKELTAQVEQIRQEQVMPAMVLNRYRNSICFIFGLYQVGYPGQRPSLRARVSGTGFVVSDGLLATNRHVAEPWYGDSEAESLVRSGATPQLERLLAFFPGVATPVDVTPVALSAQGDLAVLRIEGAQHHHLRPLPLASTTPAPGELVAVIGYPMGVLGMVAKSPQAVYDRLAYRRDDINAANELAALSLIRPSATCGHLGDVVGQKLIYDAPTAHGGSGGPVFNSRGEVIGVNSAYIDGFSGGTLGVSIDALRPLITVAQKMQPREETVVPASTTTPE